MTRPRYIDEFYRQVGQRGDPCVYCGLVADTLDHVPPFKKARELYRMGNEGKTLLLRMARLYPACAQCNSALNTKETLWTINERRDAIYWFLTTKYRDWLCMPDWTPEDIEKLDGSLKVHIEKGLIIKAVTEERLANTRRGR